MEYDFAKVVDIKLILYLSEHISSFKIKFHKNVFLFCFRKAKDIEDGYKNIFGCEVWTPF
jgi:hypothetical protein